MKKRFTMTKMFVETGHAPSLQKCTSLGFSACKKGNYSEWRWFLENMQTSRKKGGESKTFPIEYIENRLEKIIVREGEEGINKFRDKAREIAHQLEFEKEFDRLNILSLQMLTKNRRKEN